MAEQTLTADDLARYAAALAEGKKPLVYLVEGVPSLGLEPGSSARVVEVDGAVVTVKPTGIDDQLPYDARELRATKQPKAVRRGPKAAPAKGAAKPATATTAPAKPAKAAPVRTARSVAITVYVGADNTASLKVTRNAQKPAGVQEIPLPALHKALAGPVAAGPFTVEHRSLLALVARKSG